MNGISAIKETKRVVVADDHELFREAIKSRLERMGNCEVVGEASEGRGAIALCRKHKPNLLVLDLIMPTMDGTSALASIKEVSPETRILISTSNIDIIEAHTLLSQGVHGYFLKQSNSEEFSTAVQTVLSGGAYLPTMLLNELVEAASRTRNGGNMFGLTLREVDILLAIATFGNNKDVARQFDISVRTVESHRQNIRKKTGAQSLEALKKIAEHL